MLRYLFSKVIWSTVTLFLLAVLTFFQLRLAPGGPFDEERAFPPEIRAAIDARYGLDKPLPEQFSRWLFGAVRGDLGESFQYASQPVAELISESVGVSAALGVIALVFAASLGIPLGVWSASNKGNWRDRAAIFFSISGVALPSYLVASVLVLVFSLQLGWLPPALWNEPLSWVLPSITLGLRPLALIARMTRSSVLETLQSDYIRTAYGKGLSKAAVFWKHALRNSLIPVVTLMGPVAASLVTGSFLVETVFQIPGIGRHFVSAVLNRDYPLVMGVTLLYGVILIGSNLAVDLLYAWVDPRIRVVEAI